MIVICSWCKKVLREKEPLEDKSLSHTICDEYQSEYFLESEVKNERMHRVLVFQDVPASKIR